MTLIKDDTGQNINIKITLIDDLDKHSVASFKIIDEMNVLFVEVDVSVLEAVVLDSSVTTFEKILIRILLTIVNSVSRMENVTIANGIATADSINL